MKIRELLSQEIDIDVYDNVCDDIGIAFCGPMEVTPEGEKEWADVLDYDFKLSNYCGNTVALVNVDFPDWEHRIDRAKQFFWSIAGYCSCDDYDRWFKEVD